jgi:zinc transporter ZupT
MKGTNWVIIIAAGVFVGLCACACAGLGFFALPSLLPKTTYTVGYDVAGNGTITYTNEYGDTEQSIVL